MQYHSMSLASQPNTHVSLIGYRESDPHPNLVGQPNVSIHPVSFQTFKMVFYQNSLT